MGDLSPCSIVLRFVRYVNQGDLEGIASLVSEDVKFTDIRGRVCRERDFMAGYLVEFPDYKIHIHHALQGGNGVAIVGKTTGSHVPPDVEEEGTLVWTAEIRDGLISEWRIYSDEEYAQRS
jgi:ketosteroid isomerase-like protein